MTNLNKPTLSPNDIAQYRKSLFLTQKEFALLMGVTYQAVMYWETGQRCMPEPAVRLIHLFQKFPQLITEY